MNCKQGTKLIIEQMVELLEKLSIQQYGQPLQLFNGSSIGQHFRHIYDCYNCLYQGIEYGRVDYAKRERDALIETDPNHATGKFTELLTGVGALNEDQSVNIVADFSSELNASRPVVTSTIARELMYAYDHAVHHLAMIKMGLKEICPNVEVNKNLGVAPSTVKHWKQKQKEDSENSSVEPSLASH
ncbi:MAG: hypothetical protein AAFZ15_20750 [Bacteroidota bacterium]